MNYYPPYYQNYPNYQQQYPQPTQSNMSYSQNPGMQMPQNQILAWVQTEDEGVNFPLNAGQSIFLMNQREPFLYMKSVDQLGKVTFVKKRLVDESGGDDNLKDYIKREELENLITDRIQKEVEKRFSEISFKPTKASEEEHKE